MTFEPTETLRDPFVLYGDSFNSRLLLGTARYPSPATLQAAVEISHPAMVTVALRRQGAVGEGEGAFQSLFDEEDGHRAAGGETAESLHQHVADDRG